MDQNISDVEIKAMELRNSMFGKTLKQQKQIVYELKNLYEGNPTGTVVLEYVKSLVGLSRNQGDYGDIDGAKEIIKELKELYDKYNDENIASACAWALNYLSYNQGNQGDINGARETIKILKTLYEKDEKLASDYAWALRDLSRNQGAQGDIDGAKETIKILKSLYEKDEKLASYYAGALSDLSRNQGVQGDIDGAKEMIKSLKSLCENDENIASDYAWALSVLSWKQGEKGDLIGAKETIKELKESYDKYKKDGIFEISYVLALRKLSEIQSTQGDIDGAKETTEKDLKPLYDKHKDIEIASFYVSALLSLLWSQVNIGNIEEAENTIKEIKSLYDEYKEEELFVYITINQISDVLAEIVNIDNEKISENLINLLDNTVRIFKSKLVQEASNTFNKIIDKYESTEKKDLYARLIQIYICIAKIKNMLIIKGVPKELVGHYTKIINLNNLLKKTDECRLWLFNASYMNDPSEGRTLLEYLKEISTTDNQKDIIDKLVSKYTEEFGASNVYLSSLSQAIDILPMWSMYGKDGQGCCLVFDPTIFDIPEDNLLLDTVRDEKDADLDQSPQMKTKKLLPETNEKSNKFYLHEICYLPNEISGKRAEQLKKLVRAIDHISLDELDEMNEKNIVLDLIADSLDEIRYLFKTDDYSYEKEYRLLKLVDITSDKVKLCEVENSIPRLYVKLEKKLKYKEIILGPKVSDPDFIAPYITYVDSTIKVRKSSIEYR
ncbi:MAG: DUF2971 domain-containing protein [Christensenellaceae bacterium]|nr:DUF2971 domain-containing protein [Christensenellaceae bacterium]